MSASQERSGQVLLLWLNLLGWEVELGQSGTGVVGSARHCDSEGRVHRVHGRAQTLGEVSMQLFERAMWTLDQRRHQVGSHRAA